MVRTIPIAAITLALAACATVSHTSHSSHTPPPSSASTIADPRTRIVAGATAMLGQPYHWGGAAPGGFDCSGLVVYATGRVGISLPRTAQEQLRAGAPISRRELQAGDLVFMHLAHKALHVGIVIDDRHFVHAPSAGGRVRIDSLDARPYAQGYLAARRIIEGRLANTSRTLQ